MSWQPIETAPKDGTFIDLWADGERQTDCRWADAGCWVTKEDGCDWYVSEATHWMPLPEPPSP